MKLIIDIPEEMYQNAKEDLLCGSELIVNAIKNGTPLEQEPKAEWISVSERLPEEEGDYLLWGKVYAGEKDEYSFIGEYDSGYEQFGYWQEQFDSITLSCLGSDFFEYGKVEAWIPLPTPYKAESEGDNE